MALTLSFYTLMAACFNRLSTKPESLSNSSRDRKAIEAVKEKWAVVDVLSTHKKAGQIGLPSSISLVAGVGFEPTTFGL